MQTFPEPEWGEPCIIETKCTDSLKAVKNPYMLTGFFVQWIRAIFKSSDNISLDKIKDYLWNEDVKLSRITIDPAFQDNPEAERRQPGIYIKRNSVSHSTPGMKGGLSTMHTDANGFFKGKDLTSIISGGHKFICVGGTEAEAENIGLEVFYNLIQFTEAIKDIASLGVFWVSALSETQHAGKGKDYWVCEVNTTWHYTFDWTLDREAPILKEIGYHPVI